MALPNIHDFCFMTNISDVENCLLFCTDFGQIIKSIPKSILNSEH